MYPRTPLPSTFNTSRFPLGAPSFYSMSSLRSLRLLRRRMRDRPRHFCYFVLLLYRPSTLCNCSTRTSNPCCQCSSIRFPPIPRSPSSRFILLSSVSPTS
jgi:hypothetical protein